MTSATTFQPGQFTWNELGTRDVAAAKSFYTELLGWRLTDEDMGEMGTYTLIWVGEQHIGGMYELKGPQFEGVPPNWMGYVAVEDTDASAAKTTELGGKVYMPPMDIPDVGRMAIVADPAGASFAIFAEPEGKCTAPPPAVHGTFAWNELNTRDPEGAKTFYSGLFGWNADSKDVGTCIYTMFSKAFGPCAGMMPMEGEQWGDTPPHWMTYIRVDDCDAVATKAGELGAQVCVPPMDIPTGRFAVLTDPTGAVFSIIAENEASCD